MTAKKNKLINVVTALMLVLSLFTMLPEGALKAAAAEEGANYRLSDDGTLTFFGTVSSTSKFANDERVKKVVFENGTMMPESCVMLFMNYCADSIDFSGTD